MASLTPDPQQDSAIHPELLAKIPPERREEFKLFLRDPDRVSAEFNDWFNSSPDAVEVVDLVLEATVRRWGTRQLERIERTGGVYQAGEELAEKLGVDLDTGMRLSESWTRLAKQLADEQDELDRSL